MRGLQKSKRVSWPLDANLCQVKLFQSEECPSDVGIGTRTNLTSKKRKLDVLYTKGSVGTPAAADRLLPGFEGVRPRAHLLKNNLARIPHAKWRSPPTFVLSPLSRVAAGEESEEIRTQNTRELSLLEAVYPRPLTIPPNPIVSLEVENASFDDSRTPLVRLTPIEDEESGGKVSVDSTSSSASNPLENGSLADCVQPQHLADALSALASTGGLEKLIDRELLMKVVTNPATLEQFNKRQGNPLGSQNALPSSQPSQVAPPQPVPSNHIWNPSIPHFNQLQDTRKPPSTVASSNSLYQHPSPPITTSVVQPAASSSSANAPPPVKDMNYYKSLIQQHGGGKQLEGLQQPQFISYHVESNPNFAPLDNSSNTRESKLKFTKPCSFFNSIKGCRRGAECTYVHDQSLRKRANSVIQMQSAKRMKIDTVMRGSQIYG